MRFTTFHNPQSENPADDGRRIMETLDECVAVDRLGFDVIWLAEHHFVGYTVYEDAITFAAALSGRTSRAKIGFALLTFPLYQPVRLASQLALLDHLLQGRLIVGASPGYINVEFQGYGISPEERRQRLDETLDLVQRAWTEAPFEYEWQGTRGSVPMVRPRPYQQPMPEFIHGVISADSPSMRQAAAAGRFVLFARYAIPRVKEELRKFEAALREAGQPEDVIRRCLKLSEFQRHIYVAETDQQALEEISAPIEWLLQREKLVNAPEKVHAQNELKSLPFDLEAFWERGVIAGSPKTVAERIAELRDAGAGTLMNYINIGNLSHEKVMQSMERFSKEVMPLFPEPGS